MIARLLDRDGRTVTTLLVEQFEPMIAIAEPPRLNARILLSARYTGPASIPIRHFHRLPRVSEDGCDFALYSEAPALRCVATAGLTDLAIMLDPGVVSRTVALLERQIERLDATVERLHIYPEGSASGLSCRFVMLGVRTL